ncbi:hypothetical protein METBIDRAFT_43952 [Metschnikowia bicuspidata var. bicuspidata NRRL YB-4993]|uniref:Protein YIF1 n=1 Tax=Metschnikowia bicuspidata var. bicuspidata NRRL YB-4993 TaxID=869754 RepID=A0A1A0H8A4_9ASCO|nr:hypothetical protein METBIDRAFT_43952 [Metschnikowia bicuspidata var. bicuspidata NRRL YB-4993]OBA20210.1 hypothetical protein METBIDRAFT_43952 [Metschnikowia bicuspidata var. bicuspidata NRRL YB-4993]
MYNPYALAVDESLGQQNLHHPRPQHYAAEFQGNTPNFQPPGQAAPGGAYGDFFLDPAASMAAQFAKSSFGLLNGYLQQNFGSYMPVAGELKYYFKVSNAYVWRKLALILFPYRHRDWTRIRSVESGGAASSGPCFAPACEDVNAPDLYIPLMALVSYVLLWALFSGLRGDFHPEVFGFVASQTLACSFVDILIFRVGLYLLNCSAQTSFWDLISFSGYKYVTIIALLCWKQVAGSSWLMYYGVLLAAVGSLSLFLMRSLKFLILPHGLGENPAASISNGQRRLRVQFLFIYSVVVQFLIVLFMCRY